MGFGRHLSGSESINNNDDDGVDDYGNYIDGDDEGSDDQPRNTNGWDLEDICQVVGV